jgi:macrolide phosphotransferase
VAPHVYPGAMSHTPLMLSALATSAVPGFQAVSAQSLSTPQRDAALVYDANGLVWLVELPRTQTEDELMAQQRASVKALTEGLRSRLTFRVPKVHGTTDVGGKTLSVSEYLPGQELRPADISPILATGVGTALSEIHQLPVSTLMDFDRPADSALDSLRECAGVVDRAAATALLPQSLLRRWETACEDAALWQFEPTVIHGLMQSSRFLREGEAVVAIDEWREFKTGDPARDLAWLTTPSASAFVNAVMTSYRSGRPQADRHVLQRGRLWAELDIARWLLHGIDSDQEKIVEDATEMLQTLNDRVSGDMDQALTMPISHNKHPLAPK